MFAESNGAGPLVFILIGEVFIWPSWYRRWIDAATFEFAGDTIPSPSGRYLAAYEELAEARIVDEMAGAPSFDGCNADLLGVSIHQELLIGFL